MSSTENSVVDALSRANEGHTDAIRKEELKDFPFTFLALPLNHRNAEKIRVGKEKRLYHAAIQDTSAGSMVFCNMYVSADAKRERRSHMADVIYVPHAPRAPFDVERAPEVFESRVQDKLRNSNMFKYDPKHVAAFLDEVYSTNVRVITACVANIHKKPYTSYMIEPGYKQLTGTRSV